MNNLSPITPDPDFERQVMLRAWLSQLGDAPIPSGFDEAVLRSAKRRGPWKALITSVVAVVVVGSLWFAYESQPQPVRVTYVPQSPIPLQDLYNLPPLSVEVDARFTDSSVKKAHAPVGVAGY